MRYIVAIMDFCHFDLRRNLEWFVKFFVGWRLPQLHHTKPYPSLAMTASGHGHFSKQRSNITYTRHCEAEAGGCSAEPWQSPTYRGFSWSFRKMALLIFGVIAFSSNSFAQQKSEVSQSEMQAIYNEVKTPYKYGLVIVPDNNSKKIDCPSVFRKGKNWYMTYVIFDGRGYETWLSKSEDLLNWQTLGRVMSFGDTTKWDGNQRAGYIALQDNKWGGNYKLKKYKGKYWMSYFGGAVKGYEAGDLSIGMAYTTVDPSIPHEWKRFEEPLFTSKDTDVRWWENRKLFKSSVVWDKEKITGHPFVMYYNANGDSAKNNLKTRWFERIGMAVSDDMMNWKRFNPEPVVHHPVGITGDAVVQKMGDNWVMFYFGAFWQDRKGAFNRFTVSKDMVNWTDWTGDNLIQSSEPYDELYAHKSFVVKHKGVVYHFYCAVNKKEQRGIAVATSKDLGKSKINFISTQK